MRRGGGGGVGILNLGLEMEWSMQAMGMEFLYPPLALGECNQYVSQRASEPASQMCEPCKAYEVDVRAMRGRRARHASHRPKHHFEYPEGPGDEAYNPNCKAFYAWGVTY